MSFGAMKGGLRTRVEDGEFLVLDPANETKICSVH
jgi:hypothetical protein